MTQWLQKHSQNTRPSNVTNALGMQWCNYSIRECTVCCASGYAEFPGCEMCVPPRPTAADAFRS